MTDLIQTIASAVNDALDDALGYDPEAAEGPLVAPAILTALHDAGYAIVPRDAKSALEDAVYVIRNVTCESEWSKRHGWRDPDADVDEDLRCWADHWRSSHESVAEIAAQQDAAITTGERNG